MSMILKWKLRDYICQFESWGMNLTLTIKLRDQNSYFAKEKLIMWWVPACPPTLSAWQSPQRACWTVSKVGTDQVKRALNKLMDGGVDGENRWSKAQELKAKAKASLENVGSSCMNQIHFAAWIQIRFALVNQWISAFIFSPLQSQSSCALLIFSTKALVLTGPKLI